MEITKFISDIEKWATENDMVNSVILVGSYARGQAREDSDVDLCIISTTPKMLISDESFIEEFGKVIRKNKEQWGRVTSIRVWYEDGLEVEFGITSPLWISKPLDEGTFKVLSDGYKVIIDKKYYFKNIF